MFQTGGFGGSEVSEKALHADTLGLLRGMTARLNSDEQVIAKASQRLMLKLPVAVLVGSWIRCRLLASQAGGSKGRHCNETTLPYLQGSCLLTSRDLRRIYHDDLISGTYKTPN